MTLLTLWHFYAQCDLLDLTIFQHVIIERVKKVMLFLLIHPD
jgi:hypothetical protein